MKRIFAIIFFGGAVLHGLAQQPVTITSADIYLNLKKLNVLGSVLYIAAHPDDENTRLLAYLSKDKLYRTGYLALTRGDGGQNLIGDEQGVPLGLIRTQELLAARRIDGAEQFFSRAFDFGFSKNPQETFTKWDKEKIVSDVVWVIRNFQPDVIITRFPTTGEGGHGHHTASAILANEAFSAAADPARFPGQLKYVQPWQAKRILWNTFNFGNVNTTSNDQFKIDVGGFNAVMGKSYGEIAAESRSQHKSQGFGVARSRGESWEYFKTTGGEAPQKDLIDNLDASWKRVKGSEKVVDKIQVIIKEFDLAQPQKSVASLVDLYKALSLLQPGYWRNKKLGEVQQLIAQCSGLWYEATTTVQNAVQGDPLQINFTANNRSTAIMKLKKVSLDNFDTTFSAALTNNQNFNFSKSIQVGYSKPVTQPYWLQEKMSEGMFTINNQQLIGQPDITPAFTANFDVEVEGVSFTFQKPVQYKYTDAVKGEIYQPVFVVPPVTIATTPPVLLFKKNENEKEIASVQAIAFTKVNSNNAVVELKSADYSSIQKDSAFVLNKGFDKRYNFSISNKNIGGKSEQTLQSILHYTLNNMPLDAALSMASINYEHIPSIRYFYNDDIKVLDTDLKTAGKKVGYIVGAGDKVPEALRQMGYDVTLLGNRELAAINLQQFDAVITGVRAYNTDEWITNYYDKLMQYVKGGGNMIVQYSQTGNIPKSIGPYPFTISRNRVTDENAAVTFLQPGHPVLNFPNKITQDDFKGWVQERSTYHATDLDKAYETIFAMHDPGEKEDNGSLIIAKYGSGYFTYTGLVFFRELPAGVPGAYRLLANIIALNAKKSF